MHLPPFMLERYFARHEFTARHLLSASDCESLSLEDVLNLADEQCRELWSHLRLGYTESQGHPLLREEVSRTYRSIAPSEAIIAAPEEAIFITMHAILKAGDDVIVVTPAYQSLYELARSLGCHVIFSPLRAVSGHWQLDLDRLLELVTPRTRLVVVNFPHNPTGALPSGSEWAALVGHVQKQGTYLLSDEMYRLSEYGPAARLPAMCDAYERGISLSGLSKVFGLPGLRIGWLATRDHRLMESLQVVKDYTTICCSSPSEILALIALRAQETILARNRAIIHENLEHAGRFFSKHTGRFAWSPPQAGPVALPELLGSDTADDFCRRALTDLGIMIVPGSVLAAGERHFRLGLGRKSLPQALDLLDRWSGLSEER